MRFGFGIEWSYGSPMSKAGLLIVPLLGGIILCASAIIFFIEFSFVSRAGQAQGTVIKLVKKGSRYSPQIRFTTQQEKTITFTTSWSTTPPVYDVGDKVKIFYKKSDPKWAKVDGFFSLYLWTFISSIMGAVMFIVGLLVMRYCEPRRIKNPVGK